MPFLMRQGLLSLTFLDSTCFHFSLVSLTLLCLLSRFSTNFHFPSFSITVTFVYSLSLSYGLDCQVLVRTRKTLSCKVSAPTRIEFMCTVLSWSCFAGSQMYSSVPQRWGLDFRDCFFDLNDKFPGPRGSHGCEAQGKSTGQGTETVAEQR